MKKLHYLLLVIMTMAGWSCLNNDEEGSGIGDAMIISKIIGGKTVYGISINAYTYSEFRSIQVKEFIDDELKKTYTLKPLYGSKSNFIYETPENDYSTTKPKEALYNYNAVFTNGATQTFNNALTDQVRPVPVFNQCEYIAGKTNGLKVKWNSDSKADGYSISIIDETNLIFSMVGISNRLDSMNIYSDGKGWISNFKPVKGKEYKLLLTAILEEPTIATATYNIQSFSIADTTVVWGSE